LYPVFAQDYGSVEFVENKGQWDPQVRLSAKTTAGAIFLHNNGFTILQHNPQEFAVLTEAMHERSLAKDAVLGASILHSHAYRVAFIGANPAATILPDKAQPTYNN